MLPLKGINTDNDKAKLSGDFALDVLNGVIYKGNIQNEEGFIVHSTYLVENNLQPVGILPINDGKKVFVCVGETEDHILVLSKDGVFTPKLSTKLGLSVLNPVDLEAQYNHKKELVIAMTDGVNSPKVINLDNLASPFTLNSIEMFPDFGEPIITTDVIEGGGALTSGVYYIFTRYVDYDRSITGPSAFTNPVSIGSSSELKFSEFQGNKAGDLTSKGIRVNISNSDTSFEKIQICIAEKKEGVVNTKMVAELINSVDVTYVVNGQEKFTDITLEEAITPPVKYKTVKHLTQTDGTLYGAGVTEDKEINLQKFVLDVKLSWVSTLRDMNEMQETYKVHKNIFYNRTFAHGEVYAFYMRIKIKGKGWTRAFHIPGREVRDIYVTPSAGKENEFIHRLRDNQPSFYLLQNLQRDITLDENNIKWFHTRDTTTLNVDTLTIKEGEFGYWENLNERYPDTDDFASLKVNGQMSRVRHHKFPSHSTQRFRYGVNSSNPEFGITKKDILGVKIDFPYASFPPEIRSEIECYELLYAERDQANTTSLGEATGLMYSRILTGYVGNPTFNNGNGAVEEYFDTNFNFNGANIRFNSTYTGTNPDTVTDFIPYVGQKEFRVYNPDLLFSKQGAFPNYLEMLYTVVKDIGETFLYGPLYQGKNTIEISTTSAAGEEVQAYDFTTDKPGTGYREALNFGIYPINSINYCPQNTVYDGRNNTNSEEFISLSLNESIEGYDVVRGQDKVFVATMKTYKQDVAFNFEAQRLVSTGRVIHNPFNFLTIYGGDAFTAQWFYITHSNRLIIGNWDNSTQNPFAPRTRFRFARTLLTESKININFRYQIPGNEGTYFYPVTALNNNETLGSNLWMLTYKDNVVYNKMEYNLDYSSVNNVNAIQPYNHIDEEYFVGEDEHKIIRSNIRKPEEKNPSWRRFGANDYYIIPRNKGVITNLKGSGNALFVNTENSLFISSADEQLNVEGTTAVLGSGDIFGHSFRELVPDELGYSGTQHKFSCMLTPIGYFFIDVEKKRVFLSDGQTVKDINNGNNIFFEENLTPEIDNPFINKGYIVAWDEKYSRIMLSKVSGEAFTRSYYPTIESWFSRHSYIPFYIYNDRRDLYSLLDNVIYKHNEKRYGEFYEGEISPFHVVSVLNNQVSVDNLLSSVSWISEVTLEEEYLKLKTFDKISIWNRYQSTGDIDIKVFDTSKSLAENFKEANTRRVKSHWNFNSFRDIVVNSRLPFVKDFEPIPSNLNLSKEYILKRRLIDSFFVYKLLFTNEKISNLKGNNESPKIEFLDISHRETLVRR